MAQLMTLKNPHSLLSLHYLQSFLRPKLVHCFDDKFYKIEDDAHYNADKMNSFFRHSRKGAEDTDAPGDNYVRSSDDDYLGQCF
mmetsp:Transcript_8566/g.14067  ORF Transcript_8566/g.14067 Transcript_8566/m.14067 type:complete len:84 (+) Transcript_8566:1493-1744(+)